MKYLQKYVQHIMRNKWHLIENDLIGGWAIGLRPEPVSCYKFDSADIYASNSEPPWILVGDFMTREAAEYIINLANKERGLE
jgi:hypothetical protein